MWKWWYEQKRFATAWYYMIFTFLLLIDITTIVLLMCLPIAVAIKFQNPLWLVLEIVMIPLSVGITIQMATFID